MKIREYFEDAVDLIKQDPEPILIGNLIGMLLAAGSLGLLSGLYLCGVFHVCLKARRGQKPEIRDFFAPMERFFDPFLAGGLFALAFTLGLALYLVPAALVAGLLIWTFPILVDRRERWDAALMGSLSFARRDYAGTLLLVGLAYAVGWGGLLPALLGVLLWNLGFPWLGIGGVFLGLVLAAFLLPFTHAVIAVAWEDQTSEIPQDLVDASWIR
ncbi:MAG: hypothetical protein HYY93_08735 [Planctomycetes bacterium]|nr:hypothetical protein [Planctomycetota bacterium]